MSAKNRADALVDKVAEELHEVWRELQIERQEAHPHLIPWAEKEPLGREQDRYQAVRVVALFRGKATTISQDEIADAIHTALAEFKAATRLEALPDYLAERWDAGERSRIERSKQAERVLPLLRAFQREGAWESVPE